MQKIVSETDASPPGRRFSEIELLGGPALSDSGEVVFAAIHWPEQHPVRPLTKAVYRAVRGDIEPVLKDGDRTDEGYSVYIGCRGFGLYAYPDGTVALLDGCAPYPTVDVGLTMLLAGGGDVQTRAIKVPTPVLQSVGQSGFYFLRTEQGQTLFTVLFKDKKDRLEARQIFITE